VCKKVHLKLQLQQCVDAPENNTSVQKGTSEAATNLKKENSELKKKVRDLETTCGLITYNNEELEVKNETIEKDFSSLDDKQVYTLSEKEGNITNLKEELDKMKNSFQKHKGNDNEKDATI